MDLNERYAFPQPSLMVSNDVYIETALAKPRNWSTQSALTEIHFDAKPPNCFVCSHLGTS